MNVNLIIPLSDRNVNVFHIILKTNAKENLLIGILSHFYFAWQLYHKNCLILFTIFQFLLGLLFNFRFVAGSYEVGGVDGG